MKIVQCGNKYINMDNVTYVEWLEGVDVYMVHFNFNRPKEMYENADDTDFKLVLEEQEEIDDMARWLSANAS